MGVDRRDESTLGLLFEHILKSHSNVGNPKELKVKQEELKINYDEVVFMTCSKNNAQNLRSFKRCIKILITGLVDQFPAKDSYLPALLKELISFSQSKMRLFRFCFTQIGLQIFKLLLNNMATLSDLKTQFKAQPHQQSQSSRLQMCENAIEFIREKGCNTLVKDLIKIRAGDSTIQIRKMVLELVGELEPAELQAACEHKDLKLISLLFSSIEDGELCKVALTQLHKAIVTI